MDTIEFREVEERDWLAIHSYASLDKVSRYQPWGPNSKQETKEYVNQIVKDSTVKNRSRYGFVIMYGSDQRVIGVGELNIVDFSNRKAEISYIVHPEFWGKGIATATAGFLLNVGFNTLDLHKISATCDPRNTGSAKVLEKSGMVREGWLRHDLLIKDGWRDSLLYSILEEEWRTGRE